MKPKLAQYSNKVQREFAAQCELKEKIYIGSHDITANADTFGRKDHAKFDGIHMYGHSGCKEFTASLVNILSNVLAIQPSATRVLRDRDNFLNVKPNIKQNAPTSSNDDKTTNSVPEPTASKAPNVFRYAVKTFNRFSSFLY